MSRRQSWGTIKDMSKRPPYYFLFACTLLLAISQQSFAAQPENSSFATKSILKSTVIQHQLVKLPGDELLELDYASRPEVRFNNDCSVASYQMKSAKIKGVYLQFTNGKTTAVFDSIVYGPVFSSDNQRFAFVATKGGKYLVVNEVGDKKTFDNAAKDLGY